jgi:CRP-like cAMP-binding protein
MSEDGKLISRNRILAALSEQDKELVFRYLDRVDLSRGQVLVRPGVSIDYVYFIEQGIVSIVARATDRSIEVACSGHRRLVGLPIILGQTQSSLRAHVQIPGSALRMRAVDLHAVMGASQTFKSALMKYAFSALAEMAETVVAAGCLNVVQRVAGYLLKLSDQLEAPSIPLSHELLARALGVRRAGVTKAMHVIEGEQAIRSSRSLTVVTDSKKLKTLSNVMATKGS